MSEVSINTEIGKVIDIVRDETILDQEVRTIVATISVDKVIEIDREECGIDIDVTLGGPIYHITVDNTGKDGKDGTFADMTEAQKASLLVEVNEDIEDLLSRVSILEESEGGGANNWFTKVDNTVSTPYNLAVAENLTAKGVFATTIKEGGVLLSDKYHPYKGSLYIDFTAKKLRSSTLLIPTGTPELSAGEYALIATETGFNGTTPTGGIEIEALNDINDVNYIDGLASTQVLMYVGGTTGWTNRKLTASDIGTTALDQVYSKSQSDARYPVLSGGLIPNSYLPSFVDDVIEVANYAALPTTGEGGKIYVTLDTNLTYRWSGSGYVEISKSLALGETEFTAYRGDRGKAAYDHSLLTNSNPHGVSYSNIAGTAPFYTKSESDLRYHPIYGLHPTTGLPLNLTADKLKSNTLVIPTGTPSLVAGEYALIATETGFSGTSPGDIQVIDSIWDIPGTSRLANPEAPLDVFIHNGVNWTNRKLGISDIDLLTGTLATKEPLLPPAPTLSPELKFLNADRQWTLVSIGSGGGQGKVYFTAASSDISGYKVLSYTPEETTTYCETTLNTPNTYVLCNTFLYSSGVDVEFLDGGTWDFELFAKVSTVAGSVNMKAVVFKRSSAGIEQDLFETISEEIEDTSYSYVSFVYTAPQITVNPGDRIGVRVYGRNTIAVPTTLSWAIGDGNASFFTTPLAMRHSMLRGKNDEEAYQHITQGIQTFVGNKIFSGSIQSVLGFQGDLTGNASTATKLATPRAINVQVSGINGTAQNFDGSSPITIPVTLKTLTRGNYLTGDNFNGGADTTWDVDASSFNVASKVVVRDSNGDFASRRITMVENINTNLRIPKVAPTNPEANEFYLYASETGFSGSAPSGSTDISSIWDIPGVDPTGTIGTNQALMYNGTIWTNKTIVPEDISGLSTLFAAKQDKLNGTGFVKANGTTISYIGFGASAGTVAEGNDSRIVNGQSAFGWGNHALAGYASASSLSNYLGKYETYAMSKYVLESIPKNTTQVGYFDWTDYQTTPYAGGGFLTLNLGSSLRSLLMIFPDYANNDNIKVLTSIDGAPWGQQKEIAWKDHTHDDRYYTETEIGNFFGGSVGITGYHKSNWDTAFSWGNHAGLYLPLSGGKLTNQLIIETTSYNNFNEGIRINSAPNGWSGIILGGAAGSTGGCTTGEWFVARPSNATFAIIPASSDPVLGLNLIAGGNAKWRNNILIHEGNIGSQDVNGAKFINTSGYLSDENLAVPTLSSFGIYRVTASTATGSDGVINTWTWGTGLYATQLFVDIDSNYNMSIRHKDGNGSWVGWKRIWTEANLTNSLSNGYLPYWNNGSLVNSSIYSDGSNLGIGNNTPQSYGSTYLVLTIGNSIARGLLKFRSSYNSGDGAELFQNPDGSVNLNLNGSNTLLGFNVSKAASFTGSVESASYIKAATSVTAPTITATTSLNIGSSWSATQNGTSLDLSYGGVLKARLDSSGNITAVGGITAFAI